MDPPGGPPAHDAALEAHVGTFVDDIERLVGTTRLVARVWTQPEGYYANVWDDFVLISNTHLARLALTVDD
ncbi:hypothetical protein [Nocardia sp. NBC_00511]|uniref:hypothetical protein n=1 Tax=Nocardia sp. NBC_00511 TaxID=2903591 RepID=UPI0030DE310D